MKKAASAPVETGPRSAPTIAMASAIVLWSSGTAVAVYGLARPNLPIAVIFGVFIYLAAQALTLTGRTGSLAPFSPDFFNVWWYAPIVVGAVLRLGATGFDVRFLQLPSGIEREAFSAALLLTVSGLSVYALVVRASWRPVGTDVSPARITVSGVHWRWMGRLSIVAGVLGFVLYTFSVGGWDELLIFSNRRQLGAGLAYTQFVVRWSQLAPLAYLAAGPIRGRKLPGPSVWITLLLSTLLVGTLGGRAAVVQGWIMAVVAYHLLWRPVRLRALAAALIVAAAFSSLFLAVRASTWDNRGPSASSLVLASALGSSGTDITTERVALDIFTAVYVEVPQRTGHYMGATFTSLLFAPVPRSVWPEKPVTDESGIVGRMLLGPHGHGLPPTTAGLYYLNFAIPGIYAGFALMGFLHGRAFSALLRTRQTWGGVSYAILLVHLHDMGNAAIIDSTMMLLPVVALLVYRLVTDKGTKLASEANEESEHGGD